VQHAVEWDQRSPTHIDGNQLHLVLTHNDGILVTDVSVTDVGIADHYLISCHLAIKPPTKCAETVHIRHITGLDLLDFSSRLIDKMSTNVYTDGISADE